MSGLLDAPRTVVLRGTPMRFASFAQLAELATIQVDVLKGVEAGLDESALITADDWVRIADATQFLKEICHVQEAWPAEHDAALAIEADAIRAAIRRLDMGEPIARSSEG